MGRLIVVISVVLFIHITLALVVFIILKLFYSFEPVLYIKDVAGAVTAFAALMLAVVTFGLIRSSKKREASNRKEPVV